MAELSTQPIRLLGVAPLAGIEALRAALGCVPGPALRVRAGAEIAALLQPEPHVPLVQRGQKALLAGLHGVQRRLEVACQAGPFLPADPARACCPARVAARVLDGAWDRLGPALARHGAQHQWDVVLRWTPEATLGRQRQAIAAAAAGRGPAGLADAVGAVLRADRARREQALLGVLAPAVLAVSSAGPAGTDTELAVTVLVRAGGEAAIEAALGRLPDFAGEDASIDMRGPLPPVSFAALRLATTAPGAVTDAWRRLGLPARADARALHRHWRQHAAAIHPDRWPASGAQDGAPHSDAGAGLAAVTAAYHLLRDLMRDSAAGEPCTLAALLRGAGPRLVVPDASPADDPAASPVARGAADLQDAAPAGAALRELVEP